MDVFPEVKVKTLLNLAYYLGVMKNESNTEIEDVEFPDYWDQPQKREVLKEFSLRQCSKNPKLSNFAT